MNTQGLDDRQRIHFPEGLYGFEDAKEYRLLDAGQEPFFRLESVAEGGASFILINPFLFRPDYEFVTGDDELSKIGVTDAKNALVFSIVTIPLDGGPVTANLQGPLVISRDTHTGAQIILGDPRWKIKHDIMKELAMTKSKAAAGDAEGLPC
jgi:flagellar assembly factor FliW